MLERPPPLVREALYTARCRKTANGMVERGHRPIVDALTKMGENKSLHWVSNLAAVLWADRSIAKLKLLILLRTVIDSSKAQRLYTHCTFKKIFPFYSR